MNSIKFVGLGSGKGSTLAYFCKQLKAHKYPIHMASIITDRSSSTCVQVAKTYQIPSHIIDYKNKTYEDWDNILCQTLLLYRPQYVILAGFLKKIGPQVLRQFPNQILNSHPALIPKFSGQGMYGSKIHQAVIASKQTTTGITIHKLNQDYDKGEIISQKKIKIIPGEQACELENRIKKIEKEFYFQTFLQFAKIHKI